jgi:2-oxoglutarate dehydrogenase E2 component (dihydrolipoamide succinyltransferase)
VRKDRGEHGVEISRVHGTGSAAVTKQDILDFIDRPAPAPAPQPAPAAAPPAVHAPSVKAGPNDEIVPMTHIRRRIAEHMVMSKRTSAHVHSIFEFDFTNVSKIREARKAEYERAGVKLTYLPFIVKAVVDGLRAVPVVNSSIDGETSSTKDINIASPSRSTGA